MNQSDNGGFYGRTPGAPDIRRTYIAGMKPRVEKTPEEETLVADRADKIELQTRPVAGILFSVSRDYSGEIFPIYVGRNTIGNEKECDIYLSEDTVSANHAVLLVRMLPDGNGGRVMSASITDYDSEFGSSVNGRRLGFDKQTLEGNEIITIGNSYQFLYIPLDASAIGLEPVAGFISVPRYKPQPAVMQPQFAQPSAFYTPASIEEVYPSAVGEEDEQTFYGRTYAKKEDHSSKKTIL